MTEEKARQASLNAAKLIWIDIWNRSEPIRNCMTEIPIKDRGQIRDDHAKIIMEEILKVRSSLGVLLPEVNLSPPAPLSFGQRLRAARKKAGLTLEQAAKKSCRSVNYWWKVEHGICNPQKKYIKWKAVMDDYVKHQTQPTMGELRRFSEAQSKMQLFASAVNTTVEELVP